MKEQKTTQEKIRALHEVNSEIYKIIDSLHELDISSIMAFQNLRNATNEIQKSIAGLIDKMTENGKNETN